jgi:hypothetical protein
MIRLKMDDAEFAKLAAEGRVMTTEQAVALAIDARNDSASQDYNQQPIA